MTYLTLKQILEIHRLLIEQSGGSQGVRDQGALESAAAQPQMTFDGIDLYPTLIHKAAALGYSLIQNHPFIDGNKRIGQAAMEIFLVLNGSEIMADVDEQEKIILKVASGELNREELTQWLEIHVVNIASGKTI